MANKKVILSILAGVAIMAALAGWLIYGGSVPAPELKQNGVTVHVNPSLKDTVVKREQDGRTLWEFKVGELVNDRKANVAVLKGIQGKVFRKDGSYLDITAEEGSAALNNHDFILEGKVVANLSSGGQLKAEKITYQYKTEMVTAQGKVELIKAPWHIWADKVETTSALQQVKLRGNAKVEKGGEENAE